MSDHEFHVKTFMTSFVLVLAYSGLSCAVWYDLGDDRCAVDDAGMLSASTLSALSSSNRRRFFGFFHLRCHLLDVLLWAFVGQYCVCFAQKYYDYRPPRAAPTKKSDDADTTPPAPPPPPQRVSLLAFLLDYCYMHSFLLCLFIIALAVDVRDAESGMPLLPGFKQPLHPERAAERSVVSLRVTRLSIAVVPVSVGFGELVDKEKALTAFAALLSGSIGPLLLAIPIWGISATLYDRDRISSLLIVRNHANAWLTTPERPLARQNARFHAPKAPKRPLARSVHSLQRAALRAPSVQRQCSSHKRAQRQARGVQSKILRDPLFSDPAALRVLTPPPIPADTLMMEAGFRAVAQPRASDAVKELILRHLSYSNMLALHAVRFVVWQMYHQGFLLCRAWVRRGTPDNITRLSSYSWLLDKPPGGHSSLLYRVVTMFGGKGTLGSKVMFVVVQAVLHVMFFSVMWPAVALSAHWMDVAPLLAIILAFCVLSIRNGAILQKRFIQKLQKAVRGGSDNAAC